MAAAERLAEFVNAIMGQHGLKDRDVARRSRGFISHATVANVRNGITRDPQLSTFQGLAYGLGVPLEVIFSAVIGKPLIEGGDVKLLQVGLYFKNLPDDKQEDALLYLRGLFSRYGQQTVAEVVKLSRQLAKKAS